MPTLHLLRHAKAAIDEAAPDAERSLTRRGREAATAVGANLRQSVEGIDLILVSGARRTRETLDLVLASFGEKPQIRIEDGLYLATAAQVLDLLRMIEEDRRRVLVIGHNPGLHASALTLADPASPLFTELAASKFPTCARVTLAIEGGWTALDQKHHRLDAFVTPADLDL